MKSLLLFIPALLVLFMACNKKGENYARTPAGYRYIMHLDNPGDTPQAGDVVSFHVTVRRDGSDSIYYNSRSQESKIPTIPIPTAEEMQGEPFPPHLDLIMLLSPGDSATVVWELDTLPQKPMGFEDAKEIRYTITVVSLKRKADLEKNTDEVKAKVDEFIAALGQTSGPANLQTATSGLKYLILEQGTGPATNPGSEVSVHYYGALPDGTLFDTSFRRGEPLGFVLGEPGLIAGWTEGVDLLNQGGKALLLIPSKLGYGDQGAPPVIPPNTDLVFYIEVVSVN